MKKLLFFLLGVGLVLAACQPGASQLVVQNVWARPAAAGENGAVFLTITNAWPEDDALLSASSSVAAAVEIHRSTMQDGVMSMTPQERVDLPSGQEVVFEPGGLHIMLINLQQDLDPGDTFEITLHFENLPAQTVTVTVREP